MRSVFLDEVIVTALSFQNFSDSVVVYVRLVGGSDQFILEFLVQTLFLKTLHLKSFEGLETVFVWVRIECFGLNSDEDLVLILHQIVLEHRVDA